MKTVMEVGARAIRKTEEDENTKSSPASLLAGYENHPHAGFTDCVCLFFLFFLVFPLGWPNSVESIWLGRDVVSVQSLEL
jgi:hypothetical protein